jgi:hypothetical protein
LSKISANNKAISMIGKIPKKTATARTGEPKKGA